MSKPTFFATPKAFEAWLAKYHESANELIVGYYKKATGRPSITWPESVDEALCFGWIDGIRRRIDDEAYCIRFTPRRPKSIWSAVNIGRVAVLKKEQRMRPAGLAAYARRTEARSVTYSYEHNSNKPAQFDREYAAELANNSAAHDYFEKQPPGYRKKAVFWVQSAKKPVTREQRLQKLIAASATQQRLF